MSSFAATGPTDGRDNPGSRAGAGRGRDGGSREGAATRRGPALPFSRIAATEGVPRPITWVGVDRMRAEEQTRGHPEGRSPPPAARHTLQRRGDPAVDGRAIAGTVRHRHG